MTENTRRVAVITGAGGGLGGAAAHLLAADGVDLALIDIRREPLDQIRSLVEAAGVSGLAIEADLKSAASCEAVVESILGEYGRIDILVNCAAILDRHELADFTEADFLETFQTNVAGPFFLTRAVIGDMAKRSWGRIVNVTSTGVYEGGFTMTSTLYEASKGAVAVLTKMFAKHGAPHGILVNSLCPGGMRTRMLLEQTPADLVAKAVRDLIPLARLAEPEEMAEMIRWLVSERNTYATGAEFDVTGGVALH